jgi:uncharacterized protein (DUF1697 family)
MADLRRVVEGAGFTEVATVLQSGNLVVTSRKRFEDIGPSIARAVASELHLTSDVMVRTADEMARIVEHNPFDAFAKADPSHLTVLFLAAIPGPAAVDALRHAIVGRETIASVGTELYVTYPDGIGTSKLTQALIDRKLGTRGTARNWNTVSKLAARCAN